MRLESASAIGSEAAEEAYCTFVVVVVTDARALTLDGVDNVCTGLWRKELPNCTLTVAMDTHSSREKNVLGVLAGECGVVIFWLSEVAILLAICVETVAAFLF